MPKKKVASPTEPIDHYHDTIDYQKSVRKFFEMKSKWEELNPRNKKPRQQKCLICNNIGKMSFIMTKDIYLAKCGKTNCKLEIQRKNVVSIEEKMNTLKEKLDYLKRRFIIEKMDTLFKFIDDKNAVKLFKDEFEEYRELVKVYNEYTKTSTDQKVMERIDEQVVLLYKELENIKTLERDNGTIEDIISLYIKRIEPIAQNIQELQHPINELNRNRNGTFVLYQRPALPVFVSA